MEHAQTLDTAELGCVYKLLQLSGTLRLDPDRSCESLQQLVQHRFLGPLPYECLIAYIFHLQLLRRKFVEFHEDLLVGDTAEKTRRHFLLFVVAMLRQLGALCGQNKSLSVLKAQRLTITCMRFIWRLHHLMGEEKAFEALVNLSRTGEESTEHFYKLLHVLCPVLPDLPHWRSSCCCTILPARIWATSTTSRGQTRDAARGDFVVGEVRVRGRLSANELYADAGRTCARGGEHHPAEPTPHAAGASFAVSASTYASSR